MPCGGRGLWKKLLNSVARKGPEALVMGNVVAWNAGERGFVAGCKGKIKQ